MADSIKVSLTPDRFMVLPEGEPVESVITITNNGSTVDQYAVECDQLPTTWYSLSNTAVALFPQDKEEAKLVIHPPKGGAAKAGSYPFTVTVLSRADPTQTSRVEGLLEIGAVAAFDLSMAQPTKVTGRRGTYTLNLRNGGNSEIDVALEGSDSEDECRYSFSPSAPHLAPAQKQAVKLTVKPRRNWLVGKKKNYSFTVKGTPNVGEEKSVTGQLVHKPIFATFDPLRRLAIALVVLAALVFALAKLGGPSGASNRWQNDAKPWLCKHVKLMCVSGTPGVPAVATVPANVTALATPHLTPQTTACTYVFAFFDFHRHSPSLVGDCLENEFTNNGVASQQTTNGLLLYDHKDGHSYLITKDNIVYEYFAGVIQQVR